MDLADYALITLTQIAQRISKSARLSIADQERLLYLLDIVKSAHLTSFRPESLEQDTNA